MPTSAQNPIPPTVLPKNRVILSVLQSAANLLILMIAGGNHTFVICEAESKDLRTDFTRKLPTCGRGEHRSSETRFPHRTLVNAVGASIARPKPGSPTAPPKNPVILSEAKDLRTIFTSAAKVCEFLSHAAF